MALKLITVKPNSKSHQRVCLILRTHLSPFVRGGGGASSEDTHTASWRGFRLGGWWDGNTGILPLGTIKLKKGGERRVLGGVGKGGWGSGGLGWRALELCYENEAGDLWDKGAAEQVERGRRPPESILAPWEERLEQQGGGLAGCWNSCAMLLSLCFYDLNPKNGLSSWNVK